MPDEFIRILADAPSIDLLFRYVFLGDAEGDSTCLKLRLFPDVCLLVCVWGSWGSCLQYKENTEISRRDGKEKP